METFTANGPETVKQTRLTLRERFFSHVDTSAGEDGCWPWTGAKVRGRGVFLVGPGRDGRWRAERVSWVLSRAEPLVDSQLIVQSCGQKACVQPRHLALHKPPHAKRGRHGRVTADERDLIRLMRSCGFSTAHVAKAIGVHPTTIRKTIAGTNKCPDTYPGTGERET